MRFSLPRRALGSVLTGLFASLLAAAIGCALRNPGHDRRGTGAVRPELLCDAAAADGCPPCSIRDGARCRDRFYAAAARCADDAQCPGGACGEGMCVFGDRDKNGLDDALEREVAERNLPALAFHADEACGDPRAVLYRVRRHPLRPRRLAVTYVILYTRDCGPLNGHLGDNEAFGITVDLDAAPGAPATVGVVSQAHRGTLCESVSTCEAAPGTSGCATDGGEVVLYSSRDKHAGYLDPLTCGQNCFDDCGGKTIPTPPIVGVGQPDAPLTRDLTAEGILTSTAGWAPELLHFDAWGLLPFGRAGHPRDQLMELLAPPGP